MENKQGKFYAVVTRVCVYGVFGKRKKKTKLKALNINTIPWWTFKLCLTIICCLNRTYFMAKTAFYKTENKLFFITTRHPEARLRIMCFYNCNMHIHQESYFFNGWLKRDFVSLHGQFNYKDKHRKFSVFSTKIRPMVCLWEIARRVSRTLFHLRSYMPSFSLVRCIQLELDKPKNALCANKHAGM